MALRAACPVRSLRCARDPRAHSWPSCRAARGRAEGVPTAPHAPAPENTTETPNFDGNSARCCSDTGEGGVFRKGEGGHSEAGYGRPVDRGSGQQKQSNDPHNNQHNPQYANYWAPLTRKRHIPPHSAQPRHTNYWAPRTRKRHRQEHRPQRPTERSDPTQHAKGRTGDCPGPRKETATRRNVTRGGI